MDPRKVLRKMKGREICSLTFSVLVTGFLLYYVFSRPSGLSWKNLFIRFNPIYAWSYLGLYGVGLTLRTWRYYLLIKASSPKTRIPFGSLTLVTAVRNMLVDLLPARVGGLSYPILLNRVVGMDLSLCLTSFTYAFIFDMICLGPLLSMALLWDTLTTSNRYPWLWGLSGLILIVSLLIMMMIRPLIHRLTIWEGKLTKDSLVTMASWKEKLQHHLAGIDQSFYILNKSKIFWPLLGLSLLIRVIKYTLLYLMLSAVIEALLDQKLSLPFLIILFGLIGSEVSASLPISGLAGIGFYEGVLGATLAGLGLPPGQGISLALAMHLLTQVVDYSLGSGALIFLLYLWMNKKKGLLLNSGNGETREAAAADQKPHKLAKTS